MLPLVREQLLPTSTDTEDPQLPLPAIRTQLRHTINKLRPDKLLRVTRRVMIKQLLQRNLQPTPLLIHKELLLNLKPKRR